MPCCQFDPGSMHSICQVGLVALGGSCQLSDAWQAVGSNHTSNESCHTIHIPMHPAGCQPSLLAMPSVCACWHTQLCLQCSKEGWVGFCMLQLQCEQGICSNRQQLLQLSAHPNERSSIPAEQHKVHCPCSVYMSALPCMQQVGAWHALTTPDSSNPLCRTAEPTRSHLGPDI